MPRRHQGAKAGRAVGVFAASAAGGLWMIFLFRNPYDGPAEGTTLLLGLLMILARGLSGLAAAYGAHLAMYLLFMVSFFPLGLYAMLGPGIFQAIGWLDLGYLAGAVLVHRSVRLSR